MCVARHGQITQNNKFSISLQYLQKKFSDAVDFLHVGKHETLLKIDSMILIGMLKHSKCSQNSKFALYLQYLKKEVQVKVYFLYADKYQSFLKVYFNTLGNTKYSDILQGSSHVRCYTLKYWTICVWRLFVNQVMTS